MEGRFGRRPLLQGALAVTAAAAVPFTAGFKAAAADPLTRSSFSPFLDSTFHASDGVRRVPLVLRRIDDLSATTAATREGRFSLVFQGSARGRPLTQSTRRLTHAGRPAVDLFLVPVGMPAGGQAYQAIIHRGA